MFCCRNLACAIDTIAHRLGIRWRAICDRHDRNLFGE